MKKETEINWENCLETKCPVCKTKLVVINLPKEVSGKRVKVLLED